MNSHDFFKKGSAFEFGDLVKIGTRMRYFNENSYTWNSSSNDELLQAADMVNLIVEGKAAFFPSLDKSKKLNTAGVFNEGDILRFVRTRSIAYNYTRHEYIRLPDGLWKSTRKIRTGLLSDATVVECLQHRALLVRGGYVYWPWPIS